jgi:hypothetical protein
MSELEKLWLRTLQQVVDKAAHEIKDSLNGVTLNLEVVRSRSERESSATALAPFAEAASSQLETLTERSEALLYLARPPRQGAQADVALTLRHLAALLVPAARANGGRLEVSGWQRPAPTRVGAEAVRLALGAGLLTLIEMGGTGACSLETASDAVVRFSHESAEPCSLDSAIAASLAEQNIIIQGMARVAKSGDLVMVFPGT